MELPVEPPPPLEALKAPALARKTSLAATMEAIITGDMFARLGAEKAPPRCAAMYDSYGLSSPEPEKEEELEEVGG